MPPQIVRYEKKMRERAIREKRWLVTVSVNGKHLRDDSCTVQALVDLADAKRLSKIAVELLKSESRGQPEPPDGDLYDAYLLGCEDECLPEPLTRDAFIAKFRAGKTEEL